MPAQTPADSQTPVFGSGIPHQLLALRFSCMSFSL
jgi:hypothetical protein